MGQGQSIVVEQQRDHGGAHAAQFRPFGRFAVDPVVGELDGILDANRFEAETGGRVDLPAGDRRQAGLHLLDDGVHGHVAGHFASEVSAHAIGQYQQTEDTVVADTVLVAASNAAGIREPGDLQLVL